MRRTYLFLCASALSLALSACAIADLVIQLPPNTAGVAWIATSKDLANSDPSSEWQSDPKTFAITIPDDKLASEKVVAVVSEANTMATLPAKSGKVGLKAADFKLVAKVQVKFEDAGEGISSGSATLSSKSKKFESLIGSQDGGEATFWGVEPNSAYTATLKYKDGDQTKEFTSPAIGVSLEQAKNGAWFGFRLSDRKPAPKEASKDAQKKKKPAAPAKPEAGAPKWFTYLLGLVLGLGVIYTFYRLVLANRDAIDKRLSQMGVAIPTDPDPNAQTSATIDPTVPKPVQPIILGDADPTPLTGPVAVPIQGMQQTAPDPRLTGTKSMFSLYNGSFVVGRDATADFPLADESSLSRRHAQLDFLHGRLTVTDLGSTNGTYLNGQKVEGGPTEVPVGSVLQFGAVQFRYEE
ncbi:MAG: FHA domain-containing protein [Armatimonadetes bacterium]|nr:FHA domain-containing protein [Armatimonadota bacterium]